MTWPSPFELILIAIAILLLFGGHRLKDIMKSFGEGLREFRKATSEPLDDIQKSIEAEPDQNAQASDQNNLTEEEETQGPPG